MASITQNAYVRDHQKIYFSQFSIQSTSLFWLKCFSPHPCEALDQLRHSSVRVKEQGGGGRGRWRGSGVVGVQSQARRQGEQY